MDVAQCPIEHRQPIYMPGVGGLNPSIHTNFIKLNTMDNFKEASKLKLRFPTVKGILTTEQLWDLSLTDLDQTAVSLDEALKKSKGKSFLEKRTTTDKVVKLQFDVVLDVLQTKQADTDAATEAKKNKEHNQKILGLINEKKDGELKGKSIKQLESMLK